MRQKSQYFFSILGFLLLVPSKETKEQHPFLKTFHFWLKNDGEKWSRIFYFEIHRAPSELLLPSAKKNLPRKAELAWQVSRLVEFQNKNF